ncbi:MAG: AAA family ATPase, partial [Bacillota bacterium]
MLVWLLAAIAVYTRFYYVNPGGTLAWTLTVGRWTLTIFLTITFALVQFIAIFWFLGRAQIYWIRPGETGVTFDDYRGNPEVLEQARRVVTLLKGVKGFKEMGGEVSRGMLLVGPPGTGKSYLAQAIATEAGLPFGYLSAASIQNMFFGVSNLKIMNMYRKARRLAMDYGSCIVFLDEFDAIGMSRTRQQAGAGFPIFGGMGLLNELLLQMDPPRFEARWWARF